jgi:hypothetical protein
MNRFNRRQLLKGVGGFSLTLPFLPSLLTSQELKAAESKIPKRFVAVCNFDGYFQSLYYPTTAADQMIASDIFTKRLADIPGPISKVFDSSFDPFRSKMNLYRGLDIPGSVGHSTANMLCGAAREVFGDTLPVDPVGKSKSIDVLLSRSRNFYATVPQYSSLLGQEPSYGYGMSFDKDLNNKTIRLPYDLTPNAMFEKVFGSRIVDPAVADKFKAKKLTIGDLVVQEFKTLMGHRRIGAEDRRTVANFVDEINSLNKRINAQATILSCVKPTLRSTGSRYWDLMTDTDKKNFFSNYIDIIIAAMACNLTQIGIVSMRLFGHDHALSHADPNDLENQKKYLANTKKISDVVVEFLTKMENFKEIDGSSMLDNSVLFWGNEDSAGGPHSCISMPAATFGSAGGNINTGHYVDYRQRPFFRHPDGQEIGRSYTQLLITIMRSLGMEPSEYLTSGDGGGFGSFKVNPLYTEGRYAPYEKFRNDTLPYISKV